MEKKIVKFVIIVFFIFALTANIYASSSRPNIPGSVSHDTDITDKVDNIWATFRFIIQIASVGCVVFAGVRYMYASADDKADIKKGLVYLVIGAVLVFSATTIIQLVANSAKSIL